MSPTLAIDDNRTSAIDPEERFRTDDKPAVISNSVTVSIAAPPDDTRRALRRVDVSGPGMRALEATGFHDRILLQRGGLVWRPAGIRGHVDVTVHAHVATSDTDASFLHITTRFSPSDARAAARLLDAWGVIGPLTDALVKHSVRCIREYAENDRFEAVERARAA